MTLAETGVAAVGLWAALSVVMLLAWVMQQRTGNSGWVDVIWTLGLGGVAASFVLVPILSAGELDVRGLAVAVLVCLWAGRLGMHILSRTRSISDDPRYRSLQQGWGVAAPRNMLLLMQAQALLSVPLALSVVLAAHNPAPLGSIGDVLGVVLFIIGLGGSAVADRQLRAFKRSAKSELAVCDVGLWGWSRHPNYFFEWLVWLSYPLFAIQFGDAYPAGFLALAGPICIFWLLTRVSGIPPLEAHMLSKYGKAYALYQLRTSAFLPLPPRPINAGIET